MKMTQTSVLSFNQCVICQMHLESRQATVCQLCESALPYSNPNKQCLCCGITLNESHQRCGQCLTTKQAFDKIVPLFRYEFPVLSLIQKYKYQQNLAHGYTFSLKLAEKMHDYYLENEKPDLIIPIPLHPLKQKLRSFNQSIEIAKVLARNLACPLDKLGLRKTRFTKAQSSLSLKERSQNIKNTFLATRPLPKHILLVDDVVTTASTVNEAAKALRLQGAQKIEVACLARAH